MDDTPHNEDTTVTTKKGPAVLRRLALRSGNYREVSLKTQEVDDGGISTNQNPQTTNPTTHIVVKSEGN